MRAVGLTTYIKPVMKQYAASGKVDRSPSTSLIRCDLLNIEVGDIQRASSFPLAVEEAGRGSQSLVSADGGAVVIVCGAGLSVLVF